MMEGLPGFSGFVGTAGVAEPGVPPGLVDGGEPVVAPPVPEPLEPEEVLWALAVRPARARARVRRVIFIAWVNALLRGAMTVRERAYFDIGINQG